MYEMKILSCDSGSARVLRIKCHIYTLIHASTFTCG